MVVVGSLTLLVRGGDRSGVLSASSGEDPAGLARSSGGKRSSRPAEEHSLSGAPDRETRAALEVSVAAPGDEPSRPWRGRVKARTTGLSLEGARVALLEESRRLETQTDAEGRFELDWNGGDRPDAEVWLIGFAPVQRPHILLEEPATFELDPAGAIVGRLRGPVKGDFVEARALLWDLGVDRGAKREPLEIEIDEEGLFAFEELVAGQYSVGVSVPGWSLAFESAVQVDIGERVDLVLDPVRGALLQGVLKTKGDRLPVVGAELSAGPRMQGVSTAVEDFGQVTAPSAEDGSFTLAGLSVGENVLTAETEWGGQLVQKVHVTEAGQRIGPLALFLDRPASLAGRVVAEVGHGVSRAWVHVAWADAAFSTNPDRRQRDHEALLRVECDVNGRFRFDVLPAGRPLELVALRGEEPLPPPALRAKLFGRRANLVLRGGEKREGFELLVRESIALEGAVRDLEGTGIDDAKVEARRLGKGEPEDWSGAHSDSSGDFELLGLLPGRYRIAVKHDDYLSAYATVVVEPDIDLEPLELELEAAHRISGWVIDEWGNGIPSARVRAEAPDLAVEPGGKGPTARTRSEDFGRFELEGLPEGPWLVRADATGYEASREPVTALAPGDTALELVLKRRPPLERVAVYGEAVMLDGSAPPSLVVSNLRGGSLTREGTDFRLSGVRPGRLRFELRAAGCVPHQLGPFDLPPGSEFDLGLLEFEPAGSLTLYVRSKTKVGKPLGRFKAQLKPLPPDLGGRGGKSIGLALRLEPHRWGAQPKKVETTVASSSVLPLGSYRLLVTHRGYARYERNIELGLNQRKRSLEVVLQPKAKRKPARKSGRKKAPRKGGKAK